MGFSSGSRIGRDLVWLAGCAIVCCAVLLWLVAVRGIGTVGEFAAQVNAQNIHSLATQYIGRTVEESALRYDTIARSAQALAEAAAIQAARSLDVRHAVGSAPERLTLDETRGVYNSAQDAAVTCLYWGAPENLPQARERLGALASVDSILVQATRRLPGVKSAWVMLDDGSARFAPVGTLFADVPHPGDYDFRKLTSYSLALPDVNPDGNSVWSEVYRDTADHGAYVVTVVAPVISSSGAFLGAAGVDFSLDLLVDDIRGLSHRPGEFSFLLDGQGRVVVMPIGHASVLGLSPEVGAAGTPQDADLNHCDEPAMRTAAQEMILGRSGVRTVNLGGKDYLLGFHPLPSTKWSFATVVPCASILSSVSVTRAAMSNTVGTARVTHTLLAVGVGGMMFFILTGFVRRRVLTPVRKLVDATEAVGAGRLEHRLEGFRDDEFGQLARAFNSMTFEIAKNRDALAQAESSYRSIFENAVEGIFQTDLSGRLLSANPALATMLGYASTEQILTEVSDVGQQVYADPKMREEFILRVVEGMEPFVFEAQLMRRDGTRFWARWQGKSTRDDTGAVVCFTGLLENVTERRNAQERIHALNKELLMAQEHERKLLALHLHDNIAQNLSYLKIQSRIMAERASGGDSSLHEEFARVLSETIDAVRNMAYELRPSGLDELGLVRTLELFCSEFEQRYGVPVSFSAAGMESVPVAPEVQINIFRIVQESLRNVARHSRASKASVKLVASHPNLIVRIRDDGVGFDPERQQENAVRSRRMGVQGLKERARLMDGELQIVSRPGKGTAISLEVPIDRAWDDATMPRSL